MTAQDDDQQKDIHDMEENGQSEEAAPSSSQPGAAASNDLVAEVAELKDKLLRALAETENVRRRAERDRQDASQYAVTSFARDLLAVSDNLHRALEHTPVPDERAGEIKILIDGVELTEKELLRVFEKHGIKRIEPAKGEKFDHNFHQAMYEVPTDEQPKGTIVQVMQAGYVLKDRLLRPAMVGVAKSDVAGDKVDRVDQTA